MSNPDAKASEDEPDTRIKHGSYRIKRPGAEIHLNDNDSQFVDERTEIAVGASTDEIGGPEGVLLQATFKNGGLLEAYSGLTMTPADALALASRLERAAEAYESGQDGWFKPREDDE